MAKDLNQQKEIKITALKEAIKELIEESTPSTNYVTFQKIVDLANENNVDKFERPISVTSIKVPKSDEFREIKKLKEDCGREHKKNKSTLSRGTKKEVSILKQTIENLMIDVAKFYDDKLLLTEKLDAKDNTIAKLKEERDFYIKDIEKFKG